jgi:PIN domain nuclease of toxin-antitoxin system
LRLLLDTHTLIWWLAGDHSLSSGAREAVVDLDDEVFVSAVSAWEIETMFRIGKLPEAQALTADVGAAIASQGFVGLPITVLHGQAAGSLPGPRRDPFDRMLAPRQPSAISCLSRTKLSSTATASALSGEPSRTGARYGRRGRAALSLRRLRGGPGDSAGSMPSRRDAPRECRARRIPADRGQQ